MTLYDVTVSNFLWIADCCTTRTFSTRIIRVFYYFKYVRISTYFILSYAYPRTLQYKLKWAISVKNKLSTVKHC